VPELELGVSRIKSDFTKLALFAMAGAIAMSANALGELDPVAPEDTVGSEPPVVTVLDYTGKSHYELTELSARWDDLDSAQRRALLQEVKKRMARGNNRDGVLMIRTQRRYGRMARQADGRVLRIETKVVRIRSVKPEPAFGVGFERRAATEETAAIPSDLPGIEGETVLPPVVRVSDPTP
jgi:hypothetical protein